MPCLDMDQEAKDKCKLWFGVAGAIVTMGMSISSFVTAQNSYSVLQEIQGDYTVHITHWESLPIIDIQVVGPADACPSGYDEPAVSNDRNALQTIGEFPGSTGWCECGDNGFVWTYTFWQYWCDCGSGKQFNGTWYYTSSPGSGRCSEKADDAGCVDASQLATAQELWITQSGFCHSNASSAGCADDHPAAAVALDVWKQHRLCYKRGGWSALDRVDKINFEDAACDKGELCQSADASQDPSNTICAPSAAECPLIDLGDLASALNTNDNEPALDLSTSVVSTSGNFLPIVEIRTTIGSVCWTGSFGKSGRSNNERVANRYNSPCTEADTRFTVWDSVTEPLLYNENEISTTGNNLLGDGSYSPIQYYNTSADVAWSLSYRRQIFWSSDCASGDIKDLAAHLKPLRAVVALQHALLIVNGIFGLGILGIVLPLIMFMHACDADNDLPCIPGEGQRERDNLSKLQKVMSLTAKIAKMVPLILCLMATDDIHWFFTTAGEGECSDPLTNQSMTELGTQINDVRESNYNTLYIDCALICWYIIPAALWAFKK